MVSSINSLQNMEYMLYGGTLGANPNCPSYVNGYRTNSNWNYMNPYQGFNYGNPYQGLTFGNSIYNTPQAANTQPTTNNQVGFGSAADIKTLTDYYVKSSAPSESIGSAVIGGAAFGLINNPRMIAHPLNSLKATKAVDEMFKGIKQDGILKELWNGTAKDAAGKPIKGGYEILSEAYSRMHKLEALNHSKLGLFRKSIKGVKGSDGKFVYDVLKQEMTKALASGDVKEIANVTEKIKRVTNAYTGLIPRGLRKVGLQKQMTGLRKKINSSQYEEIGKTVSGNLAKAGEKSTLKEFLKEGVKSQKGFGGLLFGAIEFVCDFGNIKSAFEKDSKTGCKQLGQTTVKAAGSVIGWTVGEAVGAWAGAKLGAMVGSVFCPGLGTAIGAVAGLVGGSIGCALLGKATHALVGDDVGKKAEAEKLAKTPEGQVQLLQLTAQQAQNDKQLDPKVKQALNNVISQYA